ncbi:hypothetical protein CHH28_03890 [Bacterioplanes sanyensis]|uniref:Holin of 3TMs, for gene-transfer release n=1 Tax=Bacterioplanes sanyensis TaxID=1249553 RepID=A0A222FFM9_9GAMM|nr:3TM-type holin [Bacterioplanes sanyensis]ASP37867.1 hypothetical protein CHH28_03890 [Bacterioplanes sanyensis]
MLWDSTFDSILKNVTKLIDNLHTSNEEKAKIQSQLGVAEITLKKAILASEQAIIDSQQKVLVQEAKGESWLQRNWRPITMLTFLVLVVLDTFGLTQFRLSDQAWSLLQIGIGGYVVGRSCEKLVPVLKK